MGRISPKEAKTRRKTSMLSSTMTSMRTTGRRALTFALALVLTGLAGLRAQTPTPAAQQPAQPPAAPEQPIFRTGINTVRVDVIVTDRQGNPVTDLKLEDFEIQEDGKPQKTETFRL